jgi:hypothetical protein
LSSSVQNTRLIDSLIVVKWRRNACVVSDPLGVVRRVESHVGDTLCIVAQRVDLAEGSHDLLVAVHFDNPVVVLIADQRMTVFSAGGAGRQRPRAPSLVAVWIGVLHLRTATTGSQMRKTAPLITIPATSNKRCYRML